jgi:hypothetical protein
MIERMYGLDLDAIRVHEFDDMFGLYRKFSHCGDGQNLTCFFSSSDSIHFGRSLGNPGLLTDVSNVTGSFLRLSSRNGDVINLMSYTRERHSDLSEISQRAGDITKSSRQL